jgi:DNA-directed RNA polymerase subunit RPC12/RpoP
MAWFRNFYKCADCGGEWTDDWSAMCDDDCPYCGARHMSPYKSTDSVRPKIKTSAIPARQFTVMPPPVIADEEDSAAWFRNFYKCAECGGKWTDEWSAMCDDDCPYCGARHMTPYKSKDATRPRIKSA